MNYTLKLRKRNIDAALIKLKQMQVLATSLEKDGMLDTQDARQIRVIAQARIDILTNTTK